MKKLLVMMLLAAFAAIALATQGTMAQETKEKVATPAKEARWSGSVVRTDKDASFLDVRKRTMEKRIHYDSSTKWVKKGGGTIEAGAVKEGDRVICLGKYDKDKFMATQISLRTPK